MFLTLPINSTLDASVRLELDGETYELRTYWNARNTSWYLDILDSDGAALLEGKRIGTYTWLNRNVPSMSGSLIAVPLDTLDTTDPGRDDLGDRVIIMYETNG